MIGYGLAGAMLLLAAPSVGAWPLIFVAFAPALAAVRLDAGRSAVTAWRPALGGYLVGLCYALSHFYWLGDFKPLALLPVISVFALLPAGLALCLWLALRRGVQGAWLSLWVTLTWVALEALASDLFLELPSYALGYYLWRVPLLVQLADITGVFGISFWVMAINCLLAELWVQRRVSLGWLFVCGALTGVVLGYGGWRMAQLADEEERGDPLVIHALHTAVSIDDKQNDAAVRRLIDDFIGVSRDAAVVPATLTVWPETSVPLWLRSSRHRDIVQALLAAAADTGVPLLVGAHSASRGPSGQPQVFNSAFLVPARSYIAEEYHKVKLVPGVEATPYESWLPDGLRSRFASRMTPGHEARPLALGEEPLGIFICWEVFFPTHVHELVRRGASVLVNMSNDEAAFGPLRRAYTIQLPHVVLRAVETRRHLVRSANGGSSLFVTPAGEIASASPMATTGVITGTVEPRSGQTFLTRHGFLFAYAVIVAWLLGLAGLLLLRRGRH